MAKKVVKYLLEGNGSVPQFIENGGYYSQSEEMIGLSVDESIRHVPLTVVRMSKLDILAWITNSHKDSQGNYLNDSEGNPYDDLQMAEKTDSFLSALGIPDYQ